MHYLYLLLPISLLAAVTVCYLRSLRTSRVPANTQLLITAWNSTSSAQATQRNSARATTRRRALKNAAA